MKTILLTLAVLLFTPNMLHAQDVISAKAGLVNFVEGTVRQKGVENLKLKGVIKSGEEVVTENGKLEVLLTPGSYLRVGANSTFKFEDTSLENLKLNLDHGSFIIEASGLGEFDATINVVTPKGVVLIDRSGIYRIDVSAQNELRVVVEKGRAKVNEVVVKSGKTYQSVFPNSVVKFDKNFRDEMDAWSRARGKELAKINEKIAARQAKELQDSFNLPGGGSFSRSGMWFWSDPFNCYTFVPFYSSWRSPYGYSYGSWLYFGNTRNCHSCPGNYYPRPHVPTPREDATPPHPVSPNPNTPPITNLPPRPAPQMPPREHVPNVPRDRPLPERDVHPRVLQKTQPIDN